MQNGLPRAIDANLNRCREALRVCEDITRFVLNDKALTKSLKAVRHGLSRAVTSGDLMKSRNVSSDIGRKSAFDKARPENIKQLFYNNMHRAQESLRSLEEFSKLAGGKAPGHFLYKGFRFKLYSIEKKAVRKLNDID